MGSHHSLARHFATEAYNNAWANHRLLEACGRLSHADFAAPRTGFFPSIKATLNHILTVDWFYLDALERSRAGRERSVRDSIRRILAHLFQHQIHHRGQAHAMLAGTAAKPPQLDEFYCAGDAPLRAQDFAALGFSESALWREG